MKPFSNTVLLIVFKDESKRCFSIPSSEDPVDGYKRILKIEEIDKSKINKWYSFDQSLYSPEHYEKYWDVENGGMDDILIIREQKIEEIKQYRSRLFPLLDMEFMKSLEEDCAECKEHVVEIKNYLRDLPELLKRKFEKINDFETISTFNPFNNIFRISIIKKGSGYTSPPRIKIQPPLGNFPGFRMKAVATINEDGEIDEVIVTQIGSAYRQVPKIKVSPPDDPDGERAELIADAPENDIIENVSWKETRQDQEGYEKSMKKLLKIEE